MKNNILSSLTESEKERMLNMHKTATKNNYIFEREEKELDEQGHTLSDFDYERINSGEDMTYTPYKGGLRNEIQQVIHNSNSSNEEIIEILRSIADEMEASAELKNNVRDRFSN